MVIISIEFSPFTMLLYSINARWLVVMTISTLLVVLSLSDNTYSSAMVRPSENDSNVIRRTESVTQNLIIFVPGDGGSQLKAKLNKTTRVHYICELNSDWFNIWLNIHLLAPMLFDCLSENMRLHYNATTRTTYNTQGVQIRSVDFGSLDSVAYLDNYKIPGTNYFEKIISTLESLNGLVRDVDMLGAPFDFRKAPNELEDFFNNLKELIENHYIRNNHRSVTLICHSMGCLNCLYLLNRQSQGWKDVYVRRLVSLAAPWDGSFKAITAMLHGDNLGIPLLNQNKLQALQSTFPSLMYLFPRVPTFNEDQVLIETRDKNYTLKNLDDLFEATGMLDQREMWHDTREIAAKLSPPNVELWCLFGSGIDTPTKLVYRETIEANKYRVIKGDGDGTVNLESLRACERFGKSQEKPVYMKMFKNVNHVGLLRGPDAANFISSRILQDDFIFQ